MTSALLLNAAGSIVLVGLWIAAVVHVYRSLAADERRLPVTGRDLRLRSPQPAPGQARTAPELLAR